MPFTVETLIRDLSRLPHRGAATNFEAPAIELLASTLRELQATVVVEPFRTPRTYTSIIYWLVAGLSSGLLVAPWLGWVAVIWSWGWIVLAWLFFNWRFSPVTQLPPLVTSHNIIGRWRETGFGYAGDHEKPVMKVILMAHYDTAPISLLYRTGTVNSFHISLVISLVLMLGAGFLLTFEQLGLNSGWVPWTRYGLIAYFVLQALLGTLGYWLYGHSNGASDNATGVVAAIATAERLKQLYLPGLETEIVLTGAEEVGMIGSRAYLNKHVDSWPKGRTAVVNFDTLGNGSLHLIKHTGTIEVIEYANELMVSAEKLLDEKPFQGLVKPGRWHIADFDSVWFVRRKIPVMTLSAMDRKGRMPNIHRPEDQLLVTDLSTIPTAVDFAIQTIVRHYQTYEITAEKL
ncbi:M28 family metallopeptidase [Larkinella terrae]|uniref:M28 family peptidase n=1 Tax=Larkinella terrae TaxID=2025311 RepID=A0A7K0ELG8_9BACT|nr:M28 family peptidase [Larkinella terrae]MRS62624.1 M28 family peptidase [Larkinella terrae]